MKKIILGLLVTLSFSAVADSYIRRVTICSATCSKEGYNINHDAKSYGSIKFAHFFNENATDTKACEEDSFELDLATDRGIGERSFGIDYEECKNIESGAYKGKKVALLEEELREGKTYITEIVH